MPVVGTQHSSRRTVPDAPILGTATNVGLNRAFNNGRVDVTFSAPAFDGGLPITGYTVTAVEDPTKTVSGASSPLSVTGLLSATPYTFKVYATNAIGTGDGSTASSPVTVTTVPQTPNAPSATVPVNQAFAANANVNVTVTALSNGGLPITAYNATSSSTATQTGASNPLVFSEVRGTPVTYTGTLTNNNGTSLVSAASAPITPSTVPNAPTAPSASAGINNATITWSAPNDGSSAITSYDMNNTLGGIRNNVTPPYTWTGLTAGQALQFAVRANNVNGTGNYSPNSNSVTPVPPPPPPIIAIIATPVIIAIIATPVIIAIIATPPPPPPFGCVQGDTLVALNGGFIKARDIKVGTVLKSYSFDELPESEKTYRVADWNSTSISNIAEQTATVTNVEKLMKPVTMIFNKDEGTRFSLEHEMLIKRDGAYMFVQSGTIQVGDYLVSDENNTNNDTLVTDIDFINEETDVYKISLDKYNLVVAGGLITHNLKGGYQGMTSRDRQLLPV